MDIHKIVSDYDGNDTSGIIAPIFEEHSQLDQMPYIHKVEFTKMKEFGSTEIYVVKIVGNIKEELTDGVQEIPNPTISINFFHEALDWHNISKKIIKMPPI